MAEDTFIRLIFFLIGILYSILLDLIVEPIRIRWRKQANYDCKKCKVWDCPAKKCIKKSKYFIIPIILISLFTLNVNAVSIKPYDYLIFGVHDLPTQNWIRTQGITKVNQTIFTLNTTNITTSLPSDVQLFTEVYACVTQDGDNDLGNLSYITNDNQVGGFKNGNVNSVNLNIACKVPDGYNGTIYKFYFQIYEWEIPAGGADFYRVSSYWHFDRFTMKTLNITITDIYITDSDNYLDDATLASQGKGQQVIINQNNTLIDKSDKISNSITSTDDDTTSNKCGIICKLKGIFTGIANLPSKIGDLLKSLFIPSDEQMSDLLNDTQTQLNSKLDILGLPTSIYTQFLNLLTSDVNENTCIQFDDIKDPVYDQLLIGSSSFCFNTLLHNEKLNTFRTSCLLIVGGLLLLAFVSFLKKQYNRILDINDPDENYEYITSEDSYNIDYSTGEVTGMKHNERKTRREKI